MYRVIVKAASGHHHRSPLCHFRTNRGKRSLDNELLVKMLWNASTATIFRHDECNIARHFQHKLGLTKCNGCAKFLLHCRQDVAFIKITLKSCQDDRLIVPPAYRRASDHDDLLDCSSPVRKELEPFTTNYKLIN